MSGPKTITAFLSTKPSGKTAHACAVSGEGVAKLTNLNPTLALQED
jgi:hypothetical protein